MHDEASQLRHSIRGCLNALKLGAAALETGMSREEVNEFLTYVEQASDKMVRLMDQWDALPEAATA
jgi:signal transduction histidine kinase